MIIDCTDRFVDLPSACHSVPITSHGTLPFMSTRILSGRIYAKEATHIINDDLEPVVWLLLWCVLKKLKDLGVSSRDDTQMFQQLREKDVGNLVSCKASIRDVFRERVMVQWENSMGLAPFCKHFNDLFICCYDQFVHVVRARSVVVERFDVLYSPSPVNGTPFLFGELQNIFVHNHKTNYISM